MFHTLGQAGADGGEGGSAGAGGAGLGGAALTVHEADLPSQGPVAAQELIPAQLLASFLAKDVEFMANLKLVFTGDAVKLGTAGVGD